MFQIKPDLKLAAKLCALFFPSETHCHVMAFLRGDTHLMPNTTLKACYSLFALEAKRDSELRPVGHQVRGSTFRSRP